LGGESKCRGKKGKSNKTWASNPPKKGNGVRGRGKRKKKKKMVVGWGRKSWGR